MKMYRFIRLVQVGGFLVGNQGRFRANSNAYGFTVMTGWTSTKVHRDKVIFLAANHLNDLSCGGVTLFDIEEKNRHYAP